MADISERNIPPSSNQRFCRHNVPLGQPCDWCAAYGSTEPGDDRVACEIARLRTALIEIREYGNMFHLEGRECARMAEKALSGASPSAVETTVHVHKWEYVLFRGAELGPEYLDICECGMYRIRHPERLAVKAKGSPVAGSQYPRCARHGIWHCAECEQP